jgi:hypothetical protein
MSLLYSLDRCFMIGRLATRFCLKLTTEFAILPLFHPEAADK